MKTRVAIASLCGLFAIVAACSSSDEQPAGSGGVTATISLFGEEPPDLMEYRAALELVCVDAELGGVVGDPVDAGSTVDEIDLQYDEIETRLELMREVPKPAGGEDLLEELTATYDRVLLALDELSTNVDSGDTQAAVLVASGLDGLRADADEQARALGAPSCAL